MLTCDVCGETLGERILSLLLLVQPVLRSSLWKAFRGLESL